MSMIGECWELVDGKETGRSFGGFIGVGEEPVPGIVARKAAVYFCGLDRGFCDNCVRSCYDIAVATIDGPKYFRVAILVSSDELELPAPSPDQKLIAAARKVLDRMLPGFPGIDDLADRQKAAEAIAREIEKDGGIK